MPTLILGEVTLIFPRDLAHARYVAYRRRWGLCFSARGDADFRRRLAAADAWRGAYLRRMTLVGTSPTITRLALAVSELECS
jgi:hypothetical protein